jgi:hypothetical protein
MPDRQLSALPPKADIRQGNRDVCFVPKADIAGLIYSITSSARASPAGERRPSSSQKMRRGGLRCQHCVAPMAIWQRGKEKGRRIGGPQVGPE